MKHKSFIKSWLKLSILSLGIAGIFSILLVVLRSPVVNQLLPHNLFKQALIVHVNLSVLFWILSIAIVNFFEDIRIEFEFPIRILTICCLVSIILITFSAFIPHSLALLCNYIPVLQNLPFFLALSLFSTVISLMSLVLIFSLGVKQLLRADADCLANYTIALSIIISLIGFIISGHYMKNYLIDHKLEIEEFYEHLFWGGGHLLQFSFVQIMCLSWLKLTESLIGKKMQSLFKIILLVNLILQIWGLNGYKFDITDPAHQLFFTWHMKYFAGITPVIFIIVILTLIIKFNQLSNFKLIFILCSTVLFIVGGVVSFHIRGNDVTVPAHYHGSIVGITISLMGLVLLKIEKYKLGIIDNKLASIQPLCYTIGQLLHIISLAWSGGYGVLRKNTDEVFSRTVKIAMSLMGLGGLIAVIGGFLFIYICYKAFHKS